MSSRQSCTSFTALRKQQTILNTITGGFIGYGIVKQVERESRDSLAQSNEEEAVRA